MTKCKNPGEKKPFQVSRCPKGEMVLLERCCCVHGGVGARHPWEWIQPTAQPSSLRLLWLLKSERKCSGLTCPLARLQPLPKTPNILLPPRFLHFVLHVPWLGGCCKSCPEKMGCSRGWRCRAVAAAAAAGLGARRVG